ncbi:hypothetical protein FOZ63_019905, partial [Perkinsus olseni]
LHATLVENRLRTLRDMLDEMQIDLTVTLIPSERNLADPLSRPPLYCLLPSAAPPAVALPAAPALEPFPRDDDGRVVLTSRADFLVLARALHDHEGSQSLYGRLRDLVSFPDLREHCRAFVRDCPSCSVGRVTVSAAVECGLADRPVVPRASEPWESVHMDIAGPYKNQELYVTTLVDNFSGYLVTK